ncbi:response regulator transcription factor [Hyphobacterium sp. CCMP332]|nr:response regulator transcription factor [Hyphobacterium sp. CCMP332]
MKVIIIEDEKLTADHLKNLLLQIDEEIEVLGSLNSVTMAYSWFMDNPEPDLIFMDIELGDGTAFDLLDIIKIKSNIIFTTAYNQHAIKAFKYNSIDYLLKPLEKGELIKAIEKWKSQKDNNPSMDLINALKKELNQNYKHRFLVKSGDKFKTIESEQIAYFFSEDSYTHIMTKEGKKWFVDYSLEDLDEIMDPNAFFRLNRKVISSVSAIEQISSYFNARLSVRLMPEFKDQIIISRERVKAFKAWLDK